MTDEWTLINIVTDGTPIYLDGINLWDYEWVSLNESKIHVPHPQYPAQEHSMDVYEIKSDEKKVKFAAGEFSNCVWGFYKLTTNKNIK
jgi:hypothetical protein